MTEEFFKIVSNYPHFKSNCTWLFGTDLNFKYCLTPGVVCDGLRICAEGNKVAYIDDRIVKMYNTIIRIPGKSYIDRLKSTFDLSMAALQSTNEWTVSIDWRDLTTPFKLMRPECIPQKADVICSRVEIDQAWTYEYAKTVIPESKHIYLDELFRESLDKRDNFRFVLRGVVSKHRYLNQDFYRAKIGEVATWRVKVNTVQHKAIDFASRVTNDWIEASIMKESPVNIAMDRQAVDVII